MCGIQPHGLFVKNQEVLTSLAGEKSSGFGEDTVSVSGSVIIIYSWIGNGSDYSNTSGFTLSRYMWG